MNIKLKYQHIATIVTVLTFMFSCTNELWDEHYSSNTTQKSDKSIYEYIQSRSDLSIFDSMLKITGYDSVLNQPNTYTVWAPTNRYLGNIDLTDSLLVRRLVTNHITKYSHATVVLQNSNKTFTMINSKLLEFAKLNSNFLFDGHLLKEPNLAMRNGIIHILDNVAMYRPNFREFLNETQGIDSIQNYINSLTTKELNTSLSFKDGVFVDSIFKYSNPVIDKLAALDVEDSIYTAFFPTNAGWAEAMQRIRPYYKCMVDKKLPIDSGAVFQEKFSKWTLVSELFFREKLSTPVNAEYITSTNGTKYENPDRLFAGATAHAMSNGTCYTTDLLKYTAAETWNKNIIIEAEDSKYGRLLSNYAGASIQNLNSSFDISNKYFLSLTPSTSSPLSTLFAQFPLPNTLSTTYNVYCVFVPTAIVDTTDKRPYKMRFYINYIDNKNASGVAVPTGFPVVKATIDANNNLQSPSKISATFTTNGKTMQKMLVVKNLTLPFCNIYQNSKSPVTFSLMVQNAATTTEVRNYNRNIRIDCIILEPVNQ